MSLVSVHNEWDPLEEVIIGTARGGRWPQPDRGLFALEYAALGYGRLEDLPSGGPISEHIIEQTEAELELLCKELDQLGVVVRRSEPVDHSATIATPDWQTQGFFDYCPRDSLLAIGSTLIEAPMVLRSRSYEAFAYRTACLDYLASGASWISAPKPRLTDSMYDPGAPAGQRLRNLEPAFEAADILRFGTDILYLVSDGANEIGARWLQSTLGRAYRVHTYRAPSSSHADMGIAPLRPGLLLVSPGLMAEDCLPEFLRDWRRLPCPPMVDTGYSPTGLSCTAWIGMNLLVVRPGLAIVDKRQTRLIRFLEQHGIDVIPLQLTYARELRGGFHCVSLDVRRSGELETYR
ncbi:inosamine-phosphate amidinotransferase 1 [Streptomyces sp. NPDC005125]